MRTEKQKKNDARRKKESLNRMEEYNKNPNLCAECKKAILAETPYKLYDIKRKKYCSKSCAAKQNNKKFPKRTLSKDRICSCGNRKDNKAELCHQCRQDRVYLDAKKRSIKYFFNKGNARIKYGQIRSWANKILKKEGIEKTCILCNNKEFDSVVEAAHLEGIGTFPEDTPMGEVNSLDKLVYLCPSHHKLFDKGFLDKDSIKKVQGGSSGRSRF